jgi:hypothetical protein
MCRALIEACADVPSPYREALQRLPQLYGGAEVLDRAAPNCRCCRESRLRWMACAI